MVTFDPGDCQICEEPLILLQRRSDRWSCKNGHTVRVTIQGATMTTFDPGPEPEPKVEESKVEKTEEKTETVEKTEEKTEMVEPSSDDS